MSAGHVIRSRLTNLDAAWKPTAGRLVHAARARKLRRRGENVKFVDFTSTGKAVYVWRPAQKLKPYQQRMFDMLADLERAADEAANP